MQIGQDFLDILFEDDPYVIDYMSNAKFKETYDFKTYFVISSIMKKAQLPQNHFQFICTFFFLGFLLGCGPTGGVYVSSDIYKDIPPGTKLDEAILKKVEQVYPYEGGLVLMYDNSKDVFVFGHLPYLLFFDRSLLLTDAFYVSVHGLKDFAGDTIEFYKDNAYEESRIHYRLDLPDHTHYRLLDCGNGQRTNQNKLVHSIEILNRDSLNQIKIKIGFSQGKDDTFYQDVNYLARGNLTLPRDTILDLGEIHFEEKRLYTIFCNPDTSLSYRIVSDRYLFTDLSLLEEFRENLFGLILEK